MPDPVFLTIERHERRSVVPDVEGVLIQTDDEQVRMTLDDGMVLAFDVQELRLALEEAA